jgi:hypothetical protein
LFTAYYLPVLTTYYSIRLTLLPEEVSMVVGAAEASALEGGGERRQLWRTKRSLQTGGSLMRFRIELDMTYLPEEPTAAATLAVQVSERVAYIARTLGANVTRSTARVITTLVNVTRTFTRHQAATCPKGSWCTAGAEIKCDIGRYNPTENANNATACLKCPLHTTTSASGASNEELCTCDTQRHRFLVPTEYGGGCGCEAGKFFFLQMSSCVDCPTGVNRPSVE